MRMITPNRVAAEEEIASRPDVVGSMPITHYLLRPCSQYPSNPATASSQSGHTIAETQNQRRIPGAGTIRKNAMPMRGPANGRISENEQCLPRRSAMMPWTTEPQLPSAQTTNTHSRIAAMTSRGDICRITMSQIILESRTRGRPRRSSHSYPFQALTSIAPAAASRDRLAVGEGSRRGLRQSPPPEAFLSRTACRR